MKSPDQEQFIVNLLENKYFKNFLIFPKIFPKIFTNKIYYLFINPKLLNKFYEENNHLNRYVFFIYMEKKKIYI